MEYKEIVLGTVIVRYYYQRSNSHYGARLYIQRNSLTNKIIDFFNILSVWGGYDKEDNDFLSWEFSVTNVIEESTIKTILSRLA